MKMNLSIPVFLIILFSYFGPHKSNEIGRDSEHFVLVHGAGHGAWCWYKLSALLIESGHHVTAIDLAASGIDPREAKSLGLISEYFAPLRDLMGSLNKTERVILVCHSFGGLAVSQAMEMFPTRIEVAVFVTALMPGPNHNVSVVNQESIRNTGPLLDSHYSYDNGPDKPPTTFMFGPLFLASDVYQLSPIQDLTLAKSLVRPLRLFDDTDMSREIRLSEGRYGSVKRVFVVSEQDKLGKREFQEWMIEGNPPDEVVVVRGSDHMVMMSKPRKLWKILEGTEVFPGKKSMALSSTAVNRIYSHPLLKEEAKVSKLRAVGLHRMCVTASVASTRQSLPFAGKSKVKPQKDVRIALLGASGYTGVEIVRLLANHPNFGITLMTADTKAGQSIGTVFPHLITQDLPDLIAIADADFSKVDAVFCCLPHGTTQDIIKGLPKRLKIVDLSADFRLRDILEYEKCYGQPHQAPELQKEAVYGLTEIWREDIRNARLVANPGCYPTSIQLPLVPLIKAGLIKPSPIHIESFSGVSGTGRGAKEENLYTEIAEGIHFYGITEEHRHVPEIKQGLSEDAAKSKITVGFFTAVMPMSRGMHSTIKVEMSSGVTIDDLYRQLKASYEDEEFVKLLPAGVVPDTKHVRGSNYCLMNVFPCVFPGMAIIKSVIDNLGKGASGQALQNLNLMMGFPENTGLHHLPLFP